MSEISEKPQALPYQHPRLRRAAGSVMGVLRPVLGFFGRRFELFLAYFRDRQPTFSAALWPMLLLVSIVYTRCPTTNYIFDEQEALLANPYVNQVGFQYSDAIYRDFWGLPANASIGSYRPVPNYLWRGLVEVGERAQVVLDDSPWATAKLAELHAPEPVPKLTEVARRSWFQHLYNLFFHACNGAVFTALAYRLTRRRSVAWVTGLTFVCAALLTEAVSGVVGVADVLGGLGALLCLYALSLRAHIMPFAVFLALLLGLYSKESAIVCVPLVPVAAVLFAPLLHPERPARLVRGALSLVGCVAAFVLYVETRKRWFPSPLPAEFSEPLAPGFDLGKQAMRDFMVWFHQAPLPKDPLNNPLVDAPIDLRIGGALRVYARGLWQVVFPWTLSGDYSFPQEPIPERMWFFESIVGWIMMVGPLGMALGLWVVSLRREKQAAEICPDPLPAPIPSAGRLRRAMWRKLEGRSWGVWLLESATKITSLVGELLLVVFAVWLAHKLLSIGPSPINKDIGDTDPEKNIFWSIDKIRDAFVMAALFALGIGAITEAAWRRRERGNYGYLMPMSALGLVWLVISYFPHSNMAVLLPTVRAERLWYFPLLGTAFVIGPLLMLGYDKLKATRLHKLAWLVPTVFLVFQGGRAYLHAVDYRSDLDFWYSTKEAVPYSAKAHLNYSVMAGSNRMMDVRLAESHVARELAPKWAMAHIYTGDTLCRMDRPDEAWPYYKEGFDLGPNDKGLISLAFQCLWDKGKFKEHETVLRELEAKHERSWLAWLVHDTFLNGDKNNGVSREYRPRSYNEAAKEEESDTETSGSASAEATADGSASSSESAGSAQATGTTTVVPQVKGSAQP